jgi:hypothetical protein
VLLDTPEIVRPDGYSCGATTFEVMARHHGLDWSRVFRRLSTPDRGMPVPVALAILQTAFTCYSAGSGWTVADLRHHLRQGRPVACLVAVDEPADHWVLVRGLDRRRVYLHDPGEGRIDCSLRDWLRRWCGPVEYDRFGAVGWPRGDLASATGTEPAPRRAESITRLLATDAEVGRDLLHRSQGRSAV